VRATQRRRKRGKVGTTYKPLSLALSVSGGTNAVSETEGAALRGGRRSASSTPSIASHGGDRCYEFLSIHCVNFGLLISSNGTGKLTSAPYVPPPFEAGKAPVGNTDSRPR